MNLKWDKMEYANGEVAEFEGKKLAIIYARRGEVRAYVGNKRLPDSKSKSEALKQILDEINVQGKLF